MHNELAIVQRIDSYFKPGKKNWFFRDLGKLTKSKGSPKKEEITQIE
jgi:hypothetical protein